MKLRGSSYLILAMLRLGARSGYAIKKLADVSTASFWPTSLAQVYPELAALEEAGLVSRHDDSHGERRRAAYALTAEGERALLVWLKSPRVAPAQIRDEGLLRLFFADALEPSEQLELVRRLAANDQAASDWIRGEALQQAIRAEAHGQRYPTIVARLSADLLAYSAEWLKRLEHELEERSPSSANRAAD
jgi:DNA-binding PadR family transcriptional regulator